MSEIPAAEQLDPFLHIQNTDAVAAELWRLLGVREQHFINGGFSALSKAVARISDADPRFAV